MIVHYDRSGKPRRTSIACRSVYGIQIELPCEASRDINRVTCYTCHQVVAKTHGKRANQRAEFWLWEAER